MEMKLDKVNDFVQLTETGEIDLERSKQIIREIAAAALSYLGHNIIVDFRETTLAGTWGMSNILELAMEFAPYRAFFRGKLANLVPDDERWLTAARQFEVSLEIQGFVFSVFTSLEDAIKWFSETGDLRQR